MTDDPLSLVAFYDRCRRRRREFEKLTKGGTDCCGGLMTDTGMCDRYPLLECPFHQFARYLKEGLPWPPVVH